MVRWPSQNSTEVPTSHRSIILESLVVVLLMKKFASFMEPEIPIKVKQSRYRPGVTQRVPES
jgi:hypothetical protein